MTIIDAALTDLSFYHFWTYSPTILGIMRVASIAFGTLALFTFGVACSGTIPFAYPLTLTAAFTVASLVHIIQLKEMRIQDKYFNGFASV